ncbi:hypothetical protein KFL_007400060 [Klebsormidium nitens]|uniref:Transmembrane protein n=1 Tax=Klebsormidium nitens TaxID=105231 RepID=A0A1Y1IK31_KLENI|nr:hypothetical protein KFL_007400060 [Klebsormidium nitens]|eukprot:GAQ91190.1 hypothetical protein KFL_007400060 [Klebsormidium nitens]
MALHSGGSADKSEWSVYPAAGGWLAAGIGQWAWARRLQRKGLGDNPHALPTRAFSVASLYVLGGAAIVVAGLTCAGLTRGEEWRRLAQETRAAIEQEKADRLAAADRSSNDGR